MNALVFPPFLLGIHCRSLFKVLAFFVFPNISLTFSSSSLFYQKLLIALLSSVESKYWQIGSIH